MNTITTRKTINIHTTVACNFAITWSAPSKTLPVTFYAVTFITNIYLLFKETSHRKTCIKKNRHLQGNFETSMIASYVSPSWAARHCYKLQTAKF